jgi:hypothetical protein
MKTCSHCQAEKPLTDFYKSNDNRDGRCYVCKPCAHARNRKWIKDNPDKASAYYKSRRLRRQYGLTVEEYDAMLVAQAGKCAICDGPGGARGLVVDHCHATGKVRGLLCGPCNKGIGLLKESPTNFMRATEYVIRTLGE